jgi:hypothetical protein
MSPCLVSRTSSRIRDSTGPFAERRISLLFDIPHRLGIDQALIRPQLQHFD